VKKELVIVDKFDQLEVSSKMTTLRNKVEQKITKVPVKAVRVLHRMIFDQEEDRRNRKRLRQFESFAFNADEYRNKISTLENSKIMI